MIRLVSFADLLGPQHKELLDEYSAECSIPEIGPINPQAQIYAALEKSGIMQCFGVYEDLKLTGFACILTPVLPHYGLKVATLESLFVSKAFRHSDAGRELMKAVENYAKKAGCVGVLYSAPAGGQLERVLEASKGYQHTNTVFYRKLQWTH